MAWTTEQIEALEGAIADALGVRQIQFEDQTVTMQPTKDQLELLAHMRSRVNLSTRRRFRIASIDKGV